MEKDLRIDGARLQGVVDGVGRLLHLAALKERPGEHVPGVNVAADIELLARQGKGLSELDVVIGVEEGQVAIVYFLIDLAQVPDEFDKRILLLRLVRLL